VRLRTSLRSRRISDGKAFISAAGNLIGRFREHIAAAGGLSCIGPSTTRLLRDCFAKRSSYSAQDDNW
jgi:hypothetical protein